MKAKEELVKYYSENSKHSSYQSIPSQLKMILKQDDVQTRSRFDNERLNYITDKLQVKNKVILDIGGNTGFFTFELLGAGADRVIYYEGNKNHATFVSLAAKALDLNDKIEVVNRYYSFCDSEPVRADITILLNVLHHTGDDYGKERYAIADIKKDIIKQLNSLAIVTKYLVFQLGYNWMGDISRCLFENGTKQEMINFIVKGVDKHWEVQNIAVAEKKGDSIIYTNPNNKNILRDDSLGEFLNRPLFILKSKKL